MPLWRRKGDRVKLDGGRPLSEADKRRQTG